MKPSYCDIVCDIVLKTRNMVCVSSPRVTVGAGFSDGGGFDLGLGIDLVIRLRHAVVGLGDGGCWRRVLERTYK